MTAPARAWHYDGLSAVRHAVTVALEGDALSIGETGERVDLKALVPRGDRKAMVFGRRDLQGWRLGFDEAPPFVARLPGQEHYGGLLDRFGVVPAILGCAILGAIGAVGLWKGAEIAAFLVPESWEVAYGEALTGDFGKSACRSAAGQAALDRLATRLSEDRHPTRVRVIDADIINAAAIPGRQIMIFKGLIANAKSPDEVAGVLAHEIGHVERRHVMATIIRSFGFSVLVGGVDGGTVLQGLLTTGYTRTAESQADDFAIGALARANVSPADTAGFFDRMSVGEKQLGKASAALGYISSHPLSGARRALFAGSAVKGHAYAAALSPVEWKAVRAMCPPGKPDKRDKFDLFD